VAADVERTVFLVFLQSEGVQRRHSSLLARLQLQDDGVHSVHWRAFAARGEKLLATHRAGHDVADEGVAFGQIGGEVHFFPLVALFDAEAGEAEVGADGVGADEVHLAVFWLDIDIFWVLLFAEHLHAEYLRVILNVVEHVGVLVAAQPLVLPVEADGGRLPQHLPQNVFVVHLH